MKRVILALLVFPFLSPATHAQSSGIASQTLNMVLGDVIDVNFVSTNQSTGPDVQMVFANTQDYYNGIESAPQTVKVRSNSDFSVSVRATDLSAANNPAVNLPSFIYLKVPQNSTGGNVASNFSNSNYQKLSSSDITLLASCNKGDDQTFQVQYKAKPGTMVDPGVYFVNIIFTASRY